MNQLLVRADADSRIGTGHLMRTLALAQAWQSADGSATFLSRCESDGLRERIESAGFGFIRLPSSHPDGADLEATLAAAERIIRSAETAANDHWLALDGYHFDSGYQQAIQATGCHLLVMDDNAHLPHYHADVLLNQNLNANRLNYNCGPGARLLLGPDYVLLRPEFTSRRDQRREPATQARNVLVTMGGSDPDNITLRIIQTLQQVHTQGLDVRIVIGPTNPHRASLEEAISNSRIDFELLSPVTDMSALMTWADVAISAAGSSCWELALLGVPMVLLIIAENQRVIGTGIAERGAALLLGDAANFNPDRLAQTVEKLIGDLPRRQSLASRARTIVDGRGAERVVTAMMGHTAMKRKEAGI